jgi:hypothetical protein
MATIIRKKLEKAANEKGLYSLITVTEGNPYWRVRVSLFTKADLGFDNFHCAFNGRGFIIRRYEAMDKLPALVEEAMKYLNKLGDSK